jgi:UDP:flavonoid glycosyltransferase YjiC (YdhE family)
LPKPGDWHEWEHVTGYWFLETPEDYQPPPALLRFLEAGPPPFYIGFGSQVTKEPQRLTVIALAALELSGQRGILLSGWAGLSSERLPESVLCLEEVPHDWLFARVAAVVHHGGAGTTGAGLRAGVPTLITPFGLDQSGWCRVVADLGVGPKGIPGKRLTAENLAGGIHAAATDWGMRRRAAVLGEKIRAEDGINRALEVMASYL